MHGEQYSESPRRGSRGHDREGGSRPHSRGSIAHEREGSRPQSRGSISSSHYEGQAGQQRSLSAETSSRGGVRAPEPSYQSLPRRLSRLPQESRGSSGRVDRRQSFQDFKTFRDKFTGKLDFKTTLRTCEKNPDELPKAERDWIKKNEQEKRREARARARGRQYSEPREYGAGDVIESDFDFRSPPSTRDTSREGRGEEERYQQQPRRGDQVYTTPGGSRMARQQTSSPRYQYGYHDLKYGSRDELRSPSKVWSPSEEQLSPGPSSHRHMDPLSPRRVEFSAANEVFSFNKSATSGENVTPGTSRPPSRCESPAPKSILRHTASDPAHKSVSRSHTVELASPSPREQEIISSSSGRPAVRSNTTDLSFCSTPLTRPTSLIIPQAKEDTSKPTKGGQSLVQILLPKEEQAGGDSDDTLIEEKHEVEESEKGTMRSEDTGKRRVPPLLADWNRSQSFPPNKTTTDSSSQEGSNLRKLSDQGLSNSSLLSQPLAECGLHHSDIDLLRGDNEAMRLRVGDLEKQVHDNNDDIKCLKATLSECLRRIDRVEHLREESAPPAPAPRVRQRANVIEPSKPQRRPTSDYGGIGQRVQQQIHGSSGYSAHRTR